jgi:hypothetical protein
MVHHTLGYLIGETEHSLVIALSVSTEIAEEPNVSDVIQIPVVAVIDRHWVDLPSVSAKGRRSTAAASEKASSK